MHKNILFTQFSLEQSPFFLQCEKGKTCYHLQYITHKVQGGGEKKKTGFLVGKAKRNEFTGSPVGVCLRGPVQVGLLH